MAQIFKAKTLVANSGRFAYEVSAPNLVSNTGNQNIGGNKNFYTRPTVNGTGVLLSGEAANLPTTIVYTTGNQTISGTKTFVENTVFGDPSQGDFLVISGNTFTIYGSGNFTSGLFINGNPVLTGIDLSSYATSANLFTTGSTLNNKINSLSGYLNSQDIIFSGQIASTGSNLYNNILSLSGLFTGYTGSLDANFATDAQLFTTGSVLNNKINSLSGVSVLTFGDQTIYGNKNFLNNIGVSGTGVFNAIDLNNVDILSISGVDVSIVNGNVSLTNRPTVNGTGVVLSGELEKIIVNSGALLNEKINSLSGYVNSQNLIFSGQIALTGSILDNKINELSGTLGNNVVYLTGNQNINGTKNFYNTPTINGDGILSSGQKIIGGDLTGDLLSSTINKLQGYPLSINSPSAGQTLIYNGSTWVPGANANGGGGGGGLVYYFDFGNRSGIAPTGGLPTSGDNALSLLGREYAIGYGQATSNELDPRFVDRLLCSFVTASGDPGVRNIPAGLWDFNIWASVDSASAIQCSIRAVVNIYNPTNSTYRYLASSDNVYLYETDTIAQYILNATVPQTGIANNERIYIQLFGKKYTTNNRTITIYFDSYRPSHVHTTIPSIAGSGVVKVIDGVYQTPASTIVDIDVNPIANIQQSKIQNLTTDLANLNNQYSTLSTNLYNTGSILDQKINSLSGWSASSGNLFSTGSNLDNKINSLSGYVNSQDIIFSGQIASSGSSLYNSIIALSGLFTGYTGSLDAMFATDAQLFATGSVLDNKINSLSGSSVLTFGNQTISGVKTFAQTGSFNTVQITNKKLSSYNYVNSNFVFGDIYINIANSSNNIIGTLPSGITSGINYYVKNLNTGILLITGSGQRSIDGFLNINLYKNESLQLLGVNNVGYTGWVTLSADNGVS